MSDVPNLPTARPRKRKVAEFFDFLVSGSLACGVCAYLMELVWKTLDWLWYCFQNSISLKQMIATLTEIASSHAMSEFAMGNALGGLAGGVILGLITALVCLTWRELDCVLGITLFWAGVFIALIVALNVVLFVTDRTYRWPGILLLVIYPVIGGLFYGMSMGLLLKFVRWATGMGMNRQ